MPTTVDTGFSTIDERLMLDVENAYRLIETNLFEMEELVRLSLSSRDPFVDEIIRYGFRFGGKRLRPAILFLAGKTFGDLNGNHLRGAAAIELIHTATLIHDDILDGASVRRHLATMNIRWNSQVSVLAGDFLLTLAMELISRGDDMKGFRRLSAACKKTCEGELQQIGTIGRFDMTRDEYFEMIAGKTAPLLACSAELGAVYSGAGEEKIERFYQFGHKLGLAFQIIDDVLDLVGEVDMAGKTLRTDLLNRKPTLPIILFLEQADEKSRREILERLRPESLNKAVADEIIDRLHASGTIEETRRIANRLLDEAIQSLSEISSPSEPLEGLFALARYTTTRKK